MNKYPAKAAGGDAVFRDLVLARIIEPVSKLDSLTAIGMMLLAGMVLWTALRMRAPGAADEEIERYLIPLRLFAWPACASQISSGRERRGTDRSRRIANRLATCREVGVHIGRRTNRRLERCRAEVDRFAPFASTSR